MGKVVSVLLKIGNSKSLHIFGSWFLIKWRNWIRLGLSTSTPLTFFTEKCFIVRVGCLIPCWISGSIYGLYPLDVRCSLFPQLWQPTVSLDTGKCPPGSKNVQSWEQLEDAKILTFMDFPGSPMVKHLPADAGDTGLIPGLGRLHLRWGS